MSLSEPPATGDGSSPQSTPQQSWDSWNWQPPSAPQTHATPAAAATPTPDAARGDDSATTDTTILPTAPAAPEVAPRPGIRWLGGSTAAVDGSAAGESSAAAATTAAASTDIGGQVPTEATQPLGHWAASSPWPTSGATAHTGPIAAPGRGSGPGWPAVIGVSAATGLIAALAGAGLGASLAGSDLLPGASTASVNRPAGSIAKLAAGAIPSVVTIRATNGTSGATGSGFIYDTKGHVITNNHVVEGVGERITVVLDDGKRREAKIVGTDPDYDIAVLEVDAAGLKPLPIGDSTGVVVGDGVIALGAPLGLQNTVTSGIVSAVNRPVVAGDTTSRSYINAIQTDAAINPGNSGGPLLDMAGRMVGVNSAIATAAGGGQGAAGSIGLGFAIPSAQVRKTADQLIATGTSQHPVIGVLLDEEFTGPGARVRTSSSDSDPVTDGGPADKAGVKPGDVIVGFDGHTVADNDDLIVAIRAKNVGDSVPVTLERNGRRIDVRMTLQAAK